MALGIGGMGGGAAAGGNFWDRFMKKQGQGGPGAPSGGMGAPPRPGGSPMGGGMPNAGMPRPQLGQPPAPMRTMGASIPGGLGGPPPPSRFGAVEGTTGPSGSMSGHQSIPQPSPSMRTMQPSPVAQQQMGQMRAMPQPSPFGNSQVRSMGLMSDTRAKKEAMLSSLTDRYKSMGGNETGGGEGGAGVTPEDEEKERRKRMGLEMFQSGMRSLGGQR